MFSTAVLFLMLNKPVCNKHRQGQMWPDAANTDKQALLMLARTGTLEICVSSWIGYRWEHPTVNIHRGGSI
jgi:hypothetical protein